ncbi:MAG TPA: hypothetical protein VIL36_08320 [Acidimicrobiales bacterium]
MRVLRRDPDPAPDERGTGDVDADGTPDADTTDTPDAATTAEERPARRGRLSSWVRPDRDHDGRDDRVERAEADADRDRRVADADADTGVDRRDVDVDADREPVTTTTREREVVVDQWSVADAVVAIIGAGLALVGALALVRTGIDRTWFRPVETVADADHTQLLGALELGAGVLLMLTAAARSRALPALTGLAIAVAGALAAIENEEVRRELAIEESWAWMLAGIGLVVTIVSLVPPRRRRVERLVES